MARRQRIRAVRSHPMARATEQVSRRIRTGADRAQRTRHRLRGARLQDQGDGTAAGIVAEESRACQQGIMDGSENWEDRELQLAGGVRGRWWADAEPVRSGVQSRVDAAHPGYRQRDRDQHEQARTDWQRVHLGWEPVRRAASWSSLL